LSSRSSSSCGRFAELPVRCGVMSNCKFISLLRVSSVVVQESPWRRLASIQPWPLLVCGHWTKPPTQTQTACSVACKILWRQQTWLSPAVQQGWHLAGPPPFAAAASQPRAQRRAVES
jgi:hypothetical protein